MGKITQKNAIVSKKNVKAQAFGVYQPTMEMPQNGDWKGWVKRICICVPTTGRVRIEWVMARFGQIVPCNWSNNDIFQFFDQFSPLGYSVADARNYCVDYSIKGNFQWTFFIDHDVVLPANVYLKLTDIMNMVKIGEDGSEDKSKAIPIFGGLYYCKGFKPEPLIFRGRGNSYYTDWKRGDLVWCDGLPLGCTLIHNSILREVYNMSEQYTIPTLNGPAVVRRVFDTPRHSWSDPESGKYNQKVGTEDLCLFDRLKEQKIYEKAGWKKYQEMKYPLLCDTSIFCQHIDENGTRYPANVGII